MISEKGLEPYVVKAYDKDSGEVTKRWKIDPKDRLKLKEREEDD